MPEVLLSIVLYKTRLPGIFITLVTREGIPVLSLFEGRLI